ncbi:UPF0609 protein C4orf27-like protein, partial [Dinothrombium tinctorium]
KQTSIGKLTSKKDATKVYEEDSDFKIDDPFENVNAKDSEQTIDRRSKGAKKRPQNQDSPRKKILKASNKLEKDEVINKPPDGKKKDDTKCNDVILQSQSEQFLHSRKELNEEQCEKLNQLFEKVFLVRMPNDFFHLWNFCLLIKRSNPRDALLNCLNLTLIGPYDILINDITSDLFEHLSDEVREQLLCHWRYFYDPPEFQTVIKGDDETGFHIGYFRDDPKDLNPVVASNEASKSCDIHLIGDNLFVAIQSIIKQKLKKADKEMQVGLHALQRRLTEFCKSHDISLHNERLKERSKKIVARTFHGAGIVVPFENKVGYRELPMNNASLKKLLKRVIDCNLDRERSRPYSELQELFPLINFANDECDFGMGLELGIDLFSFGDDYFHKQICFLLTTAYQLLEREEFAQIITAHLKYRKRDLTDLNTLKIIK